MSRRAPIIAGAAALVVVLLVLVLLVLPKRSQISSAQGDLNKAKQDTATLQQQIAQLKVIQSKAPQIQQQMQNFANRIPPVIDNQGYIRLMQLLGQRTGADLLSLSLGNPAPASTGSFDVMTVSITATGDLTQVASLLFRLQNLPRVTKITSMSISPTSYPTLTVSISAETYTTDLQSGPGSQPGHQGTAATATGG